MTEALLYEKSSDSILHCFLCAHQCRIANKGFGFCGVRQNIDGVLYSLVYGKVAAVNVDPVEKKPLYHFLPGTNSFSFCTAGCNFHCGFCQNWELSQQHAEKEFREEATPPATLVAEALRSGCKSISYTYTEPTIFFEYALDVAKLAVDKGLYNIFVTNGYMSAECLRMLKPYLHAANVDIKFFRDDAYKKICAGRLQPVLDSVRLMKELGIWVEVTTLVVPGENDSSQELGGIARFISGVDKNIPWHISRFHPDYKFSTHPVTPETTLQEAHKLGVGVGLKYIYAGNVKGWGMDTFCSNCGKLLVKREGFRVLENAIRGGLCRYCNEMIPGVFESEKE